MHKKQVKDKDNFNVEHVGILSPRPFITITLTQGGGLPDGAYIPRGCRLRLIATSSLPSNKIRIVTEYCKTKYNPYSVSFVNKSEDSAIGMLLSIFINKVLSFLFKTNLTDLTSGFIILRRNYINEDIFKNREYGEYFIYLVSDLISQDLDLIEVSYICETRKKGYSKTANSIFQIVKRGIPYFYAAWRERK